MHHNWRSPLWKCLTFEIIHKSEEETLERLVLVLLSFVFACEIGEFFEEISSVTLLDIAKQFIETFTLLSINMAPAVKYHLSPVYKIIISSSTCDNF